MIEARPLNVFLSYASQDETAVRMFYENLKKELWINPWLDKEELLPGMDWDLEIYKALRNADMIVACFSEESVAKEGYVQREFKRALNYAEEKPDGTIFVIPLRLDHCTPPRKFSQWQWLDYFESGAHEKLLKSLRLRAKNLKILPESALPTSKKASPPEKEVVPAPSLPKVMPSEKISDGHSIYIFGGLEFVNVPEGDFFMGANDFEGTEKPQHLLYLDYDFYIARFPVTNRQYARMAGSVVMSKGKSQHPVVNVSWYDAQKYTVWLNEKYEAELPKGFRFCLPSEAEWEKAARGPEGDIYPWGDKFDKLKCNTEEGEKGETTPVGDFSPAGDSFYGVAETAGNIWEWTRSLLGQDGSKLSFKYPYCFDDGREDEGADKSIRRVLRGGAFNHNQNRARCAFRHSSNPDLRHYRSNNRGFRVAVLPVSRSSEPCTGTA